MNRDLCREFVELCFHKIQNSTWDFDQASRELERQFEAEKAIWRKQAQEESKLSGKFYL